MNDSVLSIIEQGDAAYKNSDYDAAERLYKQALSIAKKTGAETNYIYSCLANVSKKKVDGYREAYNYSRQTSTPAGFRDGAICLRKIAKQAQKAKDETSLKETLEEFYRLAVLAYLCYGKHDCKTGVRGSLYDRSVILCKSLKLNQINATYLTHGVLVGGGLLTDTDYKLFASVFGETGKTYDPFLDFAVLVRSVNDKYIKWMREYFLHPPKGTRGYNNDPFWIKMAEENITSTIEWFKQNAPWAINV